MRLLTHNMLASNVKVRALSSTSVPRFALGGGDIARLRGSPRARDRLPTSVSSRPFSSPTPRLHYFGRAPPPVSPLRIEVLQKEEREAEFHAEFLVNTLGKIEWDAFVGAAREIGADDGLHRPSPRTPRATTPSCVRSTTRCWKCTSRKATWCAPTRPKVSNHERHPQHAAQRRRGVTKGTRALVRYYT